MLVSPNEFPMIGLWGEPMNKALPFYKNTPFDRLRFPCILPGVKSIEFHVDNYLYKKTGTISVIENKDSGESNIILSVDLYNEGLDFSDGIVTDYLIFENQLDAIFNLMTNIYDFPDDPKLNFNHYIFNTKITKEDVDSGWIKLYLLLQLFINVEIIPKIVSVDKEIGEFRRAIIQDSSYALFKKGGYLENPRIREATEVIIRFLNNNEKSTIKYDDKINRYYIDAGWGSVYDNLTGSLGGGCFAAVSSLPVIMNHLLKNEIVMFSEKNIDLFGRLHPLAMRPVVQILRSMIPDEETYPRLLCWIYPWLVDRGQLGCELFYSPQFNDYYFANNETIR